MKIRPIGTGPPPRFKTMSALGQKLPRDRLEARPLYPQKQPRNSFAIASALGQKRTHALQHYRRGPNRKTASRRSKSVRLSITTVSLEE